MSEDEKKKKVAPSVLSVRVVCVNDHILSGLFVVFRLKRANDDSTQGALARVIEQLTDAGTEPKEYKGKNEKKKAVYEREKELYDRRVAHMSKVPDDPAKGWVTGFVNDDGYLVPVHDDLNPWREAAWPEDPDVYRLAEGRDHRGGARAPPEPRDGAPARAVHERQRRPLAVGLRRVGGRRRRVRRRGRRHRGRASARLAAPAHAGRLPPGGPAALRRLDHLPGHAARAVRGRRRPGRARAA